LCAQECPAQEFGGPCRAGSGGFSMHEWKMEGPSKNAVLSLDIRTSAHLLGEETEFPFTSMGAQSLSLLFLKE
jgi:hypothetical protein